MGAESDSSDTTGSVPPPGVPDFAGMTEDEVAAWMLDANDLGPWMAWANPQPVRGVFVQVDADGVPVKPRPGADTRWLGDAAQDLVAEAPGVAAVRRELLRLGPDEDLGYRELTRDEADGLVSDIAVLEPRLARVLAEVVRQMDGSPYSDGRPASRLLPLLAEFVAGGEES
jgi:hypothetical protein